MTVGIRGPRAEQGAGREARYPQRGEHGPAGMT
jgi:hypothetical protein